MYWYRKILYVKELSIFIYVCLDIETCETNGFEDFVSFWFRVMTDPLKIKKIHFISVK